MPASAVAVKDREKDPKRRDKKLRKVKRDDLDYKLGRIYTFARKYDNVKTTEPLTNRGRNIGDTDIYSGSSTSSIDSRTSIVAQTTHDTSKSTFLVKMERLSQGTKTTRTDTRPEGVGNDGNRDTGISGVRTRSKKD
ncbi:hypothetical protein NDU88_003367 [Pleurodeles waltl]|uniref:Uncharacterized protein n=1 Tax=Pleurodeles waltl TaxID=8319 RepID=A0AAV7V269_PLEWA|nr:hypothetical protein NDU88_003367 [Pleurodeles waltl]